MSSAEIAELVGSRHDNVKKTMERLASRGVIQLTSLQEVKNHLGQKVAQYNVSKRDSYVVVAQLFPEFTAKLVDRWQELEEQSNKALALPDFNDPVKSARAWADEREARQVVMIERDHAIATKAEIGSRREATSMATASAAVRKANKLEDQLGVSENWKKAKAIGWLSSYFDLNRSAYQQIGKKLTAISNDIGVEIKQVDDTSYGKVKAYHFKAVKAFKSKVMNDDTLLAKYRLQEEVA